MKAKKKTKNHLTASDFRRGTEKRLKKYDHLNFFEQFAMYIGVAQLLEIALKQLLAGKFGYDIEATERWTLGRVASELKKKGLRADFFKLLDPVVADRNYIAHELLASHLLFHAIQNSKKTVYTKEIRRLARATYELEQVFFLLEWCNENNGWN